MGPRSPTSLQGGSDGAAAPGQSTASLESSSLDPLLVPFAARLIWWQPVEQALRHPDRVIAQVLQGQPDTLTVLVADDQTQNTVKVSLFGGLSIGRVAEPDTTADGVATVAAPLDLLATKLKLMLQRAERKDYENVAVLLGSGLSLAQGLAAARALDGSGFPVRESLKALVFFEDGDLAELRPAPRQQLEEAVLAVDAIPSLVRMSDDLTI